MRLSSVYARFYKSFNFDYVSKLNLDGEGKRPRPWDDVQGQHYPFVEVTIEPQITTVVGANESGKSHLLSAIEKGIKGFSTSGGKKQMIHRRDFCRYSNWFTSVEGGPTYPDFGFKWSQLNSDDIARLRRVWPQAPVAENGSVYCFRFDRDNIVFYAGQDDTAFVPANDEGTIEHLKEWFPRVFRLEADVALPSSVSLQRLLNGRYVEGEGPPPAWEENGRRFAAQLMEVAEPIRQKLQELPKPPKESSAASVTLSYAAHTALYQLRDKLSPPNAMLDDEDRRRNIAEFNLAYDLLFSIARIKRADVELLRDSLLEGDPGTVQAIVDNMNEALRKQLNFPRVWAQDRNFSLKVRATEHEIEFLIGDRTGRSYSFQERSSGLKHFLSYYIQYLRYNPEGHSEVLLMDEPDAFLSDEGQQDLLRVFEMFVDPYNPKRKGRGPLQVIYVTHSPFLIDKNHSERVRALEKGEGTRGTRVIASAAKNHYEPLRSAFGAFVGETTFISGCNLITEGQADQILLAGASSHLRRTSGVPESDTLDLNRLTIVPSGGGDTVPDFVYLARGRGGADKPAVIVLLDSDSKGKENRDRIVIGKKGSQPAKKALLPIDFVLLLGDITRSEVTGDEAAENAQEKPFIELEDLVPLAIAARVAASFTELVLGWTLEERDALNQKVISQEMKKEKDCAFFALNRLLVKALQAKGEIAQKEPFGKVTFARMVIDLLPELANEREKNGGESDEQNGLNEFELNLRAVLRRLREMQANAERNRKEKSMRGRVEEKVGTFWSDYGDQASAPRDVARRALVDIEGELVEGDEDEISYIRQQIVKLITDHSLREDPAAPIRDFPAFLNGLGFIRTAREQLDLASSPTVTQVGAPQPDATTEVALSTAPNAVPTAEVSSAPTIVAVPIKPTSSST